MIRDWTWSTPPIDHLELLRIYEKQIKDAYAHGDFEPIVWPYRTWGFFLILVYLLLPPTRSKVIFYTKYPLFAYFVYWSYCCFRETRSVHMHGNYGIGLINVWSVIWLAALMIFSDARTEAQCIVRYKVDATSVDKQANGHSAANVTSASRTNSTGNELRARAIKSPESVNDPSAKLPPTQHFSYEWKHLPRDLRQRLIWTYHLVTSFRGAGWNFSTPSISPPPQHVLSTLQASALPPSARHSLPPSAYPSRRSVILRNLRTFAICYVVVDLWKTLPIHDPYFWGFSSAPPPDEWWLPLFIRASPVLTHTYRLLVSLAGVLAALNFIFSLNALVYCGIIATSKYGEILLGALGEPWIYSPFTGPVSVLWEDGLSGWWGRWWHQVFRVGFTAPSKWLLHKLGWSSKSGKAKVLGSVIAFGLSATVHAAGSASSWGASKPWRPAAFFVLQGVGVGIEMIVKELAKKNHMDSWTPGWAKKVVMATWVLAFMYLTGDLLAGDFAKSGIWLFEPLPVSLFRGLGYGLKEEGWWCWHGPMLFWWKGDKWWKSGIAL